MGVEIRLTDDPGLVLEQAGSFLAGWPVEHNLILTLLWQRVISGEPGRYWIAGDGGDVVGIAFLSPVGFFVTITPMPVAVVDALVSAVAGDGVAVAGVTGEAASAARFAGQWTEIRGTAAVPDMGMRIYAMAELIAPDGAVGELRPASVDDAGLVLEWIDGVHRDTGEGSVVDEATHRERIASGAYRVWCVDGSPVSMCARTPTLEGATRVYAVYTPPELRGRGYAAAGVAGLSAEILAERATPMLYTDLGNPTSNKVYRRIGYRAVAENLRYSFA